MRCYPASTGGRRLLLYSILQSGKVDNTVHARLDIGLADLKVHAHDLSHARVWDLGARWAARCPPIPGSLASLHGVALPRGNLMVPCYHTASHIPSLP